MIKPVVGKVRSPAYALPENDFVYGIESKLDKEGAGEVVQSWAQSKASDPCSVQSFPATNREALRNGCLTSKTQSKFIKQFPVMKKTNREGGTKPSNHLDSIKAAEHEPHQVFGIRTKENPISMTDLLRGTPNHAEETDYPDLSGKKRKGRLPPAKATKSSLMVAKRRESPSEEEMLKKKSVAEFKMKKFKRVKPKVTSYM